MMIVSLWLGAFVCMGFSHGIYYEAQYGSSHNFVVPRKTHFIEFSSQYNSNVTILWKWGDHSVDKKRVKTGIFYTIYDLTQRDSGRYIMRGRDQNTLSTNILEVKAHTSTYERKHGGRLSFTFNLKPNSCNIYFFPERDRQPKESMTEIVRQGQLQGGLDKFDCVGFKLFKSCGISNEALQMSCRGRFEVRDQNGDTALEVSLQMQRTTRTYEQKTGEPFRFTFDLETKFCNIYFFPESDHQPNDLKVEIVRHGWMEPVSDEYGCIGFDLLKPCGILNEALQISCSGRFEVRDQHDDTALEVFLEIKPRPYEPTFVGIGTSVMVAAVFYYCVRCYCCGKSSAKVDRAATAAAGPAEHYQELDNEPVRQRPHQHHRPRGTHYPAQPSYTPTRPLIHKHPTVNVPPPYSEGSAPAAEQAETPAVPVHSDPEPRFELKGMTVTPLSSDPPCSDVYTSNKLNFC